MDPVRASSHKPSPKVLQRICSAALVLLLLTVHSISLPDESPRQDFDQAWAEAERFLQRSAEAGHEWLDAAELLEQARLLAAEGRDKEAWEALKNGRLQAEMAVQQANREAEAWQKRVIR